MYMISIITRITTQNYFVTDIENMYMISIITRITTISLGELS